MDGARASKVNTDVEPITLTRAGGTSTRAYLQAAGAAAVVASIALLLFLPSSVNPARADSPKAATGAKLAITPFGTPTSSAPNKLAKLSVSLPATAAAPAPVIDPVLADLLAPAPGSPATDLANGAVPVPAATTVPTVPVAPAQPETPATDGAAAAEDTTASSAAEPAPTEPPATAAVVAANPATPAPKPATTVAPRPTTPPTTARVVVVQVPKAPVVTAPPVKVVVPAAANNGKGNSGNNSNNNNNNNGKGRNED